MLAVLICAVVGWIFAGYTLRAGRQEVADQRAWFQDQLAVASAREQQLLDQVQLNTQHLPYYPQIGPAEPIEEKKFLTSDDGLIVFEDYELDALAEVADL